METNPKSKALKSTVKKICSCGKEFDATVINLYGIDRTMSIVCPDCRNQLAQKEIEELELIRKNEQIRRDKEVKEKKLHWLSSCGIPLRYQNSTFDNFKTIGGNLKSTYELCFDYAKGYLIKKTGYKSMGIYSEWGLGKTHLVCAIAHYVIDKWGDVYGNCPVYYTTESSLFLRVRASFNQNNKETEFAVFEHLTKVPLLIIDDIGKEDVSDPRFVQRVWFNIVNERYNNLLPIVLTANLDPNQIAQHLGGSRNNEASIDRLYEMMGGKFWELKGNDSYRRQKEMSRKS